MQVRPSHALFALAIAAVSFALVAQQPPSSPTEATPQAGQTQAAPTTQPPPAPALPGQQPTSSVVPGASPQTEANTIRSNVRLVVLDVVVTDAKGQIVHDLKRDDFHVTEADEPQTIQNFEEAGAHQLDPDLEIDSTAALDRLAPRAPVNIVLLDEFNTRFEDMAFARYSLKKFLERQPDKLVTPTQLVAVNLQHFTVLHDYTQDKQALIRALNRHFASYPWQVHQFSWLAERYGTAFEALRSVALATEGHPGHKNMIWIGRGFPALAWENVSLDTAVRVENAVQECVNTLRDARITLYTIDPAGLMVDPGVYGSAAAFNDPFGGNYQFAKLAKATGGRSLYGRNDVDAEIGTAVREGNSFYTLTYRPTNDSRDPTRFRRIKVTLDRPGLSVSTREGYYQSYGPGRVNPQNPSRRLLADLLSADSTSMVYDGVRLTLEPSATEAGSFRIQVDPHSLGWTAATDTEARHTDLILLVSTFDKKGKELKRVGRNIRVGAPDTVPPTGPLLRGVNLVYKVDPDPKAVRVRFVVRVTGSGRIGTADADLTPVRNLSQAK
jgi:VWFA-related protein